MSEPIGEGKAKGSIFAHAKEYIKKTHGVSIWKEILGYLTEKDREFWEGSFNKTEWYPTPLLNRLIRIYDKLIGSGDFKSIEPVAEYKALLMAGAKEVIAKHTRCRYEGSNECVLEVWWK
ncbi:hypothetical protein HRbin37_00639 [bacterium HR37]|nr:hypothetical protein HRbin37_00639 [bacterium HR37]